MDLFTWNDMNEPSVFNGPEVRTHVHELEIFSYFNALINFVVFK